MTDKVDWATIEYFDQAAIKIGTWIDSNNVRHNLYKRYVAIGGWDLSANGGWMEKALNLQGYKILHASGVFYRTDAPGVVSMVPGNQIDMVLTNNGQLLRVINNLANAQTGATMNLELVHAD